MTEPKKTKLHDPKPTNPQTDDLAKKAEEAAKADQGHRAEEKVNQEISPGVEMKKIEELTNQLARCMADLQNFKRRSEEDKVRFVKFANAELLKILLPAIENLERSCKHLPENLKEDAWAKGVLHTQTDLTKALSILGVKRIDTVGKKLDLKFHEALIAGPGEKDLILEELDPGYMVNGETLKAAKVKVGDGTKN
jgi:molecular chaperone GrpE